MEDERKKIIFARNLERLLKEKRLSRQDFAKALGFKYSTVSEWMQGNKYPRVDKLGAICKYFNISIKDLTEPAGLILYANRGIGEEIRKAREKMHLTQEELAAKGNFRPQAIFNWEQGAFSSLQAPDLNRLCDYLALDADIFAPVKGFMTHRSMQRLAKRMERELLDVELTEEEIDQIVDYAKFVISKREGDK